MRTERAGGFTLVELMVVIVILGALAAMVGLKVVVLVDPSKEKIARTQIKVLQEGLEFYRLDHGRYPDRLEAQLEGEYLDAAEIPLDPWESDYAYDPTGGTTRPWIIVSPGADGIEDTEDDVTSEMIRWRRRKGSREDPITPAPPTCRPDAGGVRVAPATGDPDCSRAPPRRRR